MKELIERIDKRVNTEALRVGAYDGELMTLLSQCKAALSQKQEAVGYVDQICGDTAYVNIHKSQSILAGQDVYTAPPSTAQEDSPTKGMSLGERIAHVGGRENAAGYTEFGSVMAVKALIDHVLRDIDLASQPTAQDGKRACIESIIESLLQHGTVSINKWDHDNTYSATLKTVFGIERVMVSSGYRHRSQLSAVAGLKKQHEASKGE